MKRQTSGASSDNERQRVAERVTTSSTTSDNEWYNKLQRLAQRMKANESDFRFQNETMMQCITARQNVKQNICRSSHRRCSIKIAVLKSFAIFTGKHLKACSFIKKRL